MAFRYAGFWFRMIATVIDGVLLLLVTWALEYAMLGAYFWLGKAMGVGPGASGIPYRDAFSGITIQIVETVIYTFVSVPYFIWGHFRFQTTLGKRAVRVYVVRADDGLGISLRQSTIRCLSYLLSYLPFATGYLMAAFHPKKQGLHDILAGTICVRSYGDR